VFLVGAYLLLNLVVVFVGFYEIVTSLHTVVHWQNALFGAYGNPLTMIAVFLAAMSGAFRRNSQTVCNYPRRG
jgi:hypothetical protein